eukprot:11523-Heterococcus_DN1.PRE.1
MAVSLAWLSSWNAVQTLKQLGSQRLYVWLSREAGVMPKGLLLAMLLAYVRPASSFSNAERQLLHKVAAASVGARCSYGFPQVGLARTSADPLICADASFHNALCCPSCTLKAFAYHPCEYSVSSGLFRLSCPKLVQAIDQYEREGAINEYNKQLLTDVECQQSFDAANLVTRDIRRELVDTYPGGIDK